jgi:TldD protein
MTDRRDFLKTLGAAAFTASVVRPLDAAERLVVPPAPYVDPAVEELALYALQAARDAGASYADVRFGRYRRQSVSTRERQVTGVSDSESFGAGNRTQVVGAGGFASTADVS